jgi:hypothetical protein
MREDDTDNRTPCGAKQGSWKYPGVVSTEGHSQPAREAAAALAHHHCMRKQWTYHSCDATRSRAQGAAPLTAAVEHPSEKAAHSPLTAPVLRPSEVNRKLPQSRLLLRCSPDCYTAAIDWSTESCQLVAQLARPCTASLALGCCSRLL